MTIKAGTGNTRLLIRNLRTKTILSNEEVARLREIERAARALMNVSGGRGRLKDSLRDALAVTEVS